MKVTFKKYVQGYIYCDVEIPSDDLDEARMVCENECNSEQYGYKYEERYDGCLEQVGDVYPIWVNDMPYVADEVSDDDY